MSKHPKPSASRRPACGQTLAANERIAGRIVAAQAEPAEKAIVLHATALRGGVRETDLFCMTPLEALSLASVLLMAVAKGVR